jgi:hypothetical protein
MTKGFEQVAPSLDFPPWQRERDQLFSSADWSEFRRQVDDAIEALRGGR